MPQISALYVYPIKSCRGVPVERATVRVRGLEHDRRYMLVDERGRFLSQRVYPGMASIGVELGADGYRVTAPNQTPLELPHALPVERESEVRIWRDTIVAGLADASINHWFSSALGINCGLVYMGEQHHRAVPNDAAAFDDEVSFADAAPLLMISDASLADLNSRLERPVSMRRFRPNLVVTGTDPYAEDGWRRVESDAVELEVGWSCARCVLTTVDPDTGAKDPSGEPLETLRSYRRVGTGVMFGQNLLPRRLGELRVGAELRITEESQP